MERPRRVPVSPEVAEFEQNIAELERALPDPEARERILMIGAALQVAHRRTHGHTPDMRMTFHPASPHPNPLGVALVITLAVILIATGNVIAWTTPAGGPWQMIAAPLLVLTGGALLTRLAWVHAGKGDRS